MPRSFDPVSLVKLPKLDAKGANALLVALLTVIAAVKNVLPKSILDVVKRLSASHKALEEALSERLIPATPAAQRAADLAEDNAWSALLDWLTGFSRLPAHFAQAAQAQKVIAVLFPDGLKFTRVTYKEEWTEVQTRINRMKKDGLDQTIIGLGGQVFLDNIHAAHKAYGEALGITAEKDAETDADAVAIRPHLDEALLAIRSYALRVAAFGDEGHTEIADRLLAPLANWEVQQAAAEAGGNVPVAAGEPDTKAAAGGDPEPAGK